MTINEDTNTLYVHVYQSHVFSIHLQTKVEKLEFKFGAWQPNAIRTTFDQKLKKWNLIDLVGHYYVVNQNGNFQSNSKLLEGFPNCPSFQGSFTMDKSNGLYYVGCEFGNNKGLRQLIIKEKLEESSFVNLLPRLNATIKNMDLMIAEGNKLYFHFEYSGKLEGYDIENGKKIHESKVPSPLYGMLHYFTITERN